MTISNHRYPDDVEEVLRCAVGEFLAKHHQKKGWREAREKAVTEHLQARADREGHPFKLRKGREAA